jgi:2,5-diketo-D-gluconate reductase B
MYFQCHFERAFGTYPLKGDKLTQALEHALQVGYRAIDTAQMYGNEADVGTVLEQSALSRADFCVTSKVPNDKFTHSLFIPSVERSLSALKIDKLDVLLLHWPPADGQIDEPIELLVRARQLGLTEHVGVSNFTAAMLQRVKQITDIPIVTNQVEFHPLLNQDVLLKAAANTGIPLSSYCSVARGAVFEQALFTELGSNYGVQPGQIVLRWILQKGVSINTMSTRPENIKANFDLMHFNLSHVDMARIDALTAINRRLVDKQAVPWAPEWD